MRFTRPTRLLAVPATAALLLGLSALPADAAPVTLSETVFATDVVMAGVGGMRGGDGSATIELTGVSGPVSRALLYWHGPSDDPAPSANASVGFGGAAITGTSLGVSSDNCWGYENSWAYRADVTGLVSGNGNYALSGFTKPDAEINGVSLIVFYDDGDPSNDRDIVIFDGNDSNIDFTGPPADPEGWDVALSGINYTSGLVSLDLVVADGQDFEDDALVVNGTTIAPTGPIFQGETVPNAGGRETLWDQISFDVTSLLNPGDNTLNLTTGYRDDCLSLIVAAVNLPAGSAPNQPEPPAEETPITAPVPTAPAPAAPTGAAVTPRFTG
jgi:hypothetical protein